MCCDAEDVVAVARELGAHVACADGVEGEDRGAGSGPIAILLPADLDDLSRALACLRQLPAASPRRPPIICVLTGHCGLDTEDPVPRLLEAQRVLHASGADDVLLGAGSRVELKVAIAMSVARVESHRVAAQEAEQAQQELQRVIAAERRKRSKVSQQKSLFWEVAHRLFQDLPEMDPELPQAAKEGACVGASTLETLLGQGTFGQVWSAATEEGDTEAVKCVAKDSLGSLRSVRALCDEVLVLRALHHPNIVGLRGVAHGPSHIFVRMELAGRINVAEAMQVFGGRFNLGVSHRFTLQVMRAVEHCHVNGLAHCDVKPENVAVSDDGLHATLLDFGSATPIAEQRCDMAGTMPFMAPEVMAAENMKPYDPSGVDVWSTGVMLLEMLCGYGKLNKMLGWDDAALPRRARRDELEKFFADPHALEFSLLCELDAVDPKVLVVLSGMLQVDRHLRASATDILHSEWLQLPEPPAPEEVE